MFVPVCQSYSIMRLVCMNVCNVCVCMRVSVSVFMHETLHAYIFRHVIRV